MRVLWYAVVMTTLLAPVFAQDLREHADTTFVLSPVTIHATIAREREHPVPFSNVTGEDLRQRCSAEEIPMILSDFPSMTSYSEGGNGIGYTYVNLRGFDQRRLSIMINGIPQNDPEDHAVYWVDVPEIAASADGIQIQRGAGNAFYGPAAIGGSINVSTNPFQSRPGITMESAFGFQEFAAASGGGNDLLQLITRKFSLSCNSGLVAGKYMIYGRLGRITSGGYRNHSAIEYGSYFLGGVRLDDRLTTRVHLFGGPITDELVYNGLPKFVKNDPVRRRENLSEWYLDSTGNAYSFSKQRRPQENEAFFQPHYELLQEWKVSPVLTFHHALFYYRGDGYYDYDGYWADTSMLRLGTKYGIPVTSNPEQTLIRAFVGNRQWGWLPRIEIHHTGGTLTLGTEMRFHRSTHWGKIAFAEQLPANLDPDYHFYEYRGIRDILSVYASEVLNLRDDLTLMADLQAVYNRYGIGEEKFLDNEFSLGYFFLNPRVGLNYNVSGAANVYFSCAYTSREPRMRNLYAAEDAYSGATPQFAADTTNGSVVYDFSDPYARPERLLNLELGGGLRTEDYRVMANVYMMDFRNELVKSGRIDVFGQSVTGNADHTLHIGLEVEGSLEITPVLRFGGNVAISRNRHIRYTVYEDGTPAVYDGNPVAGFPDLLANARLTYHDKSFSASVSAKYVGPAYTDNSRTERRRNDAWTVWNLDLLADLPEFAGVQITLRGEVNNLFNALYFMYGEGDAFFPAAERNYMIGMSVLL